MTIRDPRISMAELERRLRMLGDAAPSFDDAARGLSIAARVVDPHPPPNAYAIRMQSAPRNEKPRI